MHSTDLLPCYFIGHGSPETALLNSDYHHCLQQIGDSHPDARAVLVISAHWCTDEPQISSRSMQHAVYDFYGFPAPLYQLSYNPPGDAALAATISQQLSAAGIKATLNPGHGLDHGAWVPLRELRRDAKLPVLQLSLQPHKGPLWAYQLGLALHKLRAQGVLIIASGSLTHNLRGLMGRGIDAEVEEYAAEFTRWIDLKLSTRQDNALIDYRSLAPHAARCHPSDEHLLPLHVVAGCSQNEAVSKLHESWQYGALQMGVYRFG